MYRNVDHCGKSRREKYGVLNAVQNTQVSGMYYFWLCVGSQPLYVNWPYCKARGMNIQKIEINNVDW